MKTKNKIWWSIVMIIVVLLLISQNVKNPVDGCGPSSYNHKTFWLPWGDHHHHGIDIFAKKGKVLKRDTVPSQYEAAYFAWLYLGDREKASVVKSQKAPLLLGQSVLQRLGKIEIDNGRSVLKVTQRIRK